MANVFIFDLDDTLYDETQFIRGGLHAVACYIHKKLKIPVERLYFCFLSSLRKYARGQTFDYAIKELGINRRIKISELIRIYRNHEPILKAHADVAPILSYLKRNKCRLGIITDGNMHVQKQKIKALGFDRKFDCLVFTWASGRNKQKPHRQAYMTALRRLNVTAKETVYVGDNPYKDFIGAKKLGISTVRILRGRYRKIRLSNELEADYRIKKLFELKNFL